MASPAEPNPHTLPPGSSWRTLRDLERTYHLAHGQIRNWRKNGQIEPHEVHASDTGRKEVSIDEAVIRRCLNNFRPRKRPSLSRPFVIAGADGQLAQPSQPQLLQHQEPLAAFASRIEVPQGYTTTAAIVERYLALRNLEVRAGAIQPTTFEIYRMYLRRWALHAPLFPWSADDVDTWKIKTGDHKASHPMRTLRALTLWCLERWPNCGIPPKVKLLPYKPPRPVVPPPAQLMQALALIHDSNPSLGIFCTVLAETGCRPFELYRRTWADITPTGTWSPGSAHKQAGEVIWDSDTYDLIQQLPQPHEPDAFAFASLWPRNKTSTDKLRIATITINMANILRAQGLPRITPYTFRHAFALKYKDRLPLHRLAMIMRTSVNMLTTTYGIPQDDSNRRALFAARDRDQDAAEPQ